MLRGIGGRAIADALVQQLARGDADPRSIL